MALFLSQAMGTLPGPVRSGIYWMLEVGTVTGPEYLENARAMFLFPLGSEL